MDIFEISFVNTTDIEKKYFYLSEHFFWRVRLGSKCFCTYNECHQLRRVMLSLKQSLLLFWVYYLPETVICVTSGRAQKDVPLWTIVYSPMFEYSIFEASFMLLAHLLIYHFVV